MNQMVCAYFQVAFWEWNWVFLDGEVQVNFLIVLWNLVSLAGNHR